MEAELTFFVMPCKYLRLVVTFNAEEHIMVFGINSLLGSDGTSADVSISSFFEEVDRLIFYVPNRERDVEDLMLFLLLAEVVFKLTGGLRIDD